MRAVISVYEKEGVEKIALPLYELGYEILSTGGTARYLKERGIEVTEISKVTGFPEILEGRVKTLHPAIHGGILFRDWKESDREEIEREGIVPVDVVVVNLYPFERMMARELSLEDLLEFIDIGGPTLIRAGGKNFFRVTTVVDPADYGWVGEKLKEGTLTKEDRAYLAWKAFAHTAYYDSLISNYLQRVLEIEAVPELRTVPMRLARELRYGENPHQRGFLFLNPFEDIGIARAEVVQGKEMSYNNYLDSDSAVRIALEFPHDPVCVIVKHGNPCGVAVGESLSHAFKRARSADPQSAFGGVVAFNDAVDKETARLLKEFFLEVIIAPDYEEGALRELSARKNLRVVRFHGLSLGEEVRKISGGFLIQEEDTDLWKEIKVVTEREPDPSERMDLEFAWRVCKYVRSNAVVIAKEGMTLGIGSGNVSRVDSLRCAIERATRYGFDLKGSVLASEAFFPFRDSVDLAAEAGISAIIQPGGSIRDGEVIGAANEHGIAMVFTSMRHFRH
jgi:phosphoribosylaminoimidazolecarboxamide formyltransferase/IMP cyclohydrolase